MIQIDESYIAQFWNAARAICATKNEVAKIIAEQAMKNAAIDAVQSGKPPANVSVPFMSEPDYGSFPDLKLLPGPELVTQKKVADYMPAMPALDGVVGGEIGGRMPNTARMFFHLSHHTYEHGTVRVVSGRTFKFWMPTPFSAGWLEA